MNKEDQFKITSNDYADAIVEVAAIENLSRLFNSNTVNYIDEKYAVMYFPISSIPTFIMGTFGYSTIPKPFGLTDTSSLADMGVLRVQSTSYLNLQGEGVLLGFVDTGIDYTSPLFKNADNTTRIASIWDQTIENLNATEETFYYGMEYNREQINEALKNANPLSVVPTTDEIGHGTMLAGLTGGTPNQDKDFSGVVTRSEFVIVKLKKPKTTLGPFLGIPKDTIFFQENDIMFGVRYLYETARKLNRPIAICIGLGSNNGAHDGTGALADLISDFSNRTGISIVVSAGNEGDTGHHYYGEIDSTTGYNTVELQVGEKDKSFTMELWGNIPGTYSVDITSPSGEYIPRIPARLGEQREVQFIFENALIRVDVIVVESETGDELILFRFLRATPGIWKFNVYGKGITSGFHIWLPMRNFISEETRFIRPNPYTTILNPGNAADSMTVTAYRASDKILYPSASRGYSRSNLVKPELAAPGMDVYAPQSANSFAAQSGTSLAAANATGVAAMMLEWGIVKGNDKTMDGVVLKKYLIRGVKRLTNDTYPNREWGYGAIDVFGTFINLSGE